jgi:hypothetical protein
MSILPGSRKLPLRPVLPEKVDPKEERNLIWMWEELAKYINTIAVEVPFHDNNYNGNYGGYAPENIPIGTNFNNFLDGRYWEKINLPNLSAIATNNNVLCSVNNLSGSYDRLFAGYLFRPTIRPDANGLIEVIADVSNIAWNGNNAVNVEFHCGLLMTPSGLRTVTSAGAVGLDCASFLGFGGGGSNFNSAPTVNERWANNFVVREFTYSGGSWAANNNLYRTGKVRYYIDYDPARATAANRHLASAHAKLPNNANYVNLSATAGFDYHNSLGLRSIKGINFGVGMIVYMPATGNLCNFSGVINTFEVVKGVIWG